MEGRSQLEIALEYAKKGIRVFPCTIKGKTPYIKDPVNSATTDQDIITEWWTKHENALIAHPNEDIVVVDGDVKQEIPMTKFLSEASISKVFAEIGMRRSTAFEVTTLSGGSHFYFKNVHKIKRVVRVLPQLDLLGIGGYSILPDQRNYICHWSDCPWDSFGDFPVLDPTNLYPLFKAEAEATKNLTYIVKKEKNSLVTKNKVKQKKEKMETGDGDESDNSCDLDGRVASKEVMEHIHPSAKILKDGKLQVRRGFFTTEGYASVFYNKEIQLKMADMFAIKVPSGRANKSRNFPSILPNHFDGTPSMSTRWSLNKTHLIVRDWSNFYTKAGKSSVDYNLPQLYAVMKYRKNIRIKPSEFYVWFSRLLYDAGIIDISDLKVKVDLTGVKLTKTETDFLDSIILLDAIKSLSPAYDGVFMMSAHFGKAFTGFDPSSVCKLKKNLTKKGILVECGKFDCSGGKSNSDFYTTQTYRIVPNPAEYLKSVEAEKTPEESKNEPK